MGHYPGSIGNGGVMREPGGSAIDGFAVTPSDTTVFDYPTSGIYVCVQGRVDVVMLSGNTVSFSVVPAGVTLPIRVSQVLAATTATVVALV